MMRNNLTLPWALCSLILLSYGCATQQKPHPNTHLNSQNQPVACNQGYLDLYQQDYSHLSEYVDDFIREISKINRLKVNFQLEIRRSQVMIAFGEDLIKRLDAIESGLTCEPLINRYLADRQVIFDKLEALINSQSKRLESP